MSSSFPLRRVYPLGAAAAAVVLFIVALSGDGGGGGADRVVVELNNESRTPRDGGAEHVGGVIHGRVADGDGDDADGRLQREGNADVGTLRFPRDVSGTFKGSWEVVGAHRDDGENAQKGAAEANSGSASVPPAHFVQRNFGAAAFKLTSTDSSVDTMGDVTGELVFRDGWSLGDSGFRMSVAGVYFRDTGTIIFSFESPEIEALTDEEVREEGEEWRDALIRAASEAVRGTRAAGGAGNTLYKTCRYVARLQLHDWDFMSGARDYSRYYYTYPPVATSSSMSAAYTQALHAAQDPAAAAAAAGAPVAAATTSAESERVPPAAGTGRRLARDGFAFNIPMNVTGSITSSNCKGAAEMKTYFRVVQLTEVYNKAMNYTLLVLFVSVVHVILISSQIQYSSSSQSAATKVSMTSISMHTLVDAYNCLIHFTGGIVIDPLFHPLVWTAFTKFIVFSAYELRYIMMLWKARNPNITDWHRARRELSNLYSRFYALVLLGLIFIYQFTEHVHLFVLVLYSFWIPQIAYSIATNARRPMIPAFVTGSSMLRLVIPLYIYGYSGNFLGVEPNARFCLTLTLWVLFQVMVLMTQHYYGPRCFVPAMFLPKRYNYYRPLKVVGDDLKTSGADIESGGENAGCRKQPKQVTECVICMTEVDVCKLSSRMVTPCDHVFHAECLQKWMEVKLECPTCRRPLPVEE